MLRLIGFLAGLRFEITPLAGALSPAPHARVVSGGVLALKLVEDWGGGSGSQRAHAAKPPLDGADDPPPD